jgi:hypothetical protein
MGSKVPCPYKVVSREHARRALGNADTARKLFTDGLRKNPDSARLHLSLAVLEDVAGNTKVPHACVSVCVAVAASCYSWYCQLAPVMCVCENTHIIYAWTCLAISCLRVRVFELPDRAFRVPRYSCRGGCFTTFLILSCTTCLIFLCWCVEYECVSLQVLSQ